MKNNLLTITFFCLALLIVGMPHRAAAQQVPWAASWAASEDAVVFAQIISGQRTVLPDEELKFALALKFKSGWRGYALGYGDAPPTLFDWSKSKNISNVDVSWQAPKRLKTDLGYEFIYGGEVLLPLTVTVEQVGKPIELHGGIDLVVCEKGCLPQHLDVILTLPEGAPSANMDQPRVDNAFAALPTKGDYVSLKFEDVKVEKDRLIFRVYSLSGFDEKDDLFIRCNTPNCPIMLEPPAIGINQRKPHEGLFVIPAPRGVTNLKKALKGHILTVTLIHAEHVIEKEFEF